ncbi:MAG: hypothetical protein ACRYHA_20380 [Janthinobacterium lividum]
MFNHAKPAAASPAPPNAQGQPPARPQPTWRTTASLDALAVALEPAMRGLDRCEENAWGFRQRRDRRFVFVVDTREPHALFRSVPVRFVPSDWTGARPMLGDAQTTVRGWASAQDARCHADSTAAQCYVYLVDTRGRPTAARSDNVDRLHAPPRVGQGTTTPWRGEVHLRNGVAADRVLLVAVDGGHHQIASPADVRSLLARVPVGIDASHCAVRPTSPDV